MFFGSGERKTHPVSKYCGRIKKLVCKNIYNKRGLQMNEKIISRNIDHILVYAGVLAVWNVISAAMILIKFPSYGLITLIFYALIVFISLSNLSSLVSWIFYFGSIATIISINLKLWGMSETFILKSGLVIFVYYIAMVLSRLLQRAYRASQLSLGQITRIIEDNVVYDLESGLMRWKFASQIMDNEIARSRRLGQPLSVILLSVPQQQYFPNKQIYHPQPIVSELLLSNIQNYIDIPFIGGEIGVILPEKDLEAAHEIAWQMVEDISNVLGIDITVGIASVNSADDTQDAIMERAKYALLFGVEIDHAVVTEEHISNQTLVDAKTGQWVDLSLDDVLSRGDEQVLNNLGIGINEWIVWLGGIRETEKIDWTKERFQFSEDVKFLLFQEPYMAVKINTQCEDAAEFAKAFSGWEVKEIDFERRFALLCPG